MQASAKGPTTRKADYLQCNNEGHFQEHFTFPQGSASNDSDKIHPPHCHVLENDNNSSRVTALCSHLPEQELKEKKILFGASVVYQ